MSFNRIACVVLDPDNLLIAIDNDGIMYKFDTTGALRSQLKMPYAHTVAFDNRAYQSISNMNETSLGINNATAFYRPDVTIMTINGAAVLLEADLCQEVTVEALE